MRVRIVLLFLPVLLLLLLLGGCGTPEAPPAVPTDTLAPAETAAPESLPTDAPRLADLVCTAAPGAEVHLQEADGARWLFLPAAAELQSLSFTFSGEPLELSAGGAAVTVASGEPFDLAALCAEEPEDGVWTLTLRQESDSLELKLLRSEGVASLFLSSPDGDHGRAWVESDKNNKVKGARLLLLRPDGSAVYDGGLKQIKGRGNSTWALPKRPYQIKLEEKTDLIETGDPAEASGTWVLLADYADPTHLHNRVTFDLAAELGLDFTPNCRPVDLWYDGEYRGTYLLCEKTETGKGRVAVPDLEGAIEDANAGVEDFDALPTATAVNAYGNEFQYVSGLTAPADYGAGYLLELDYGDRAREEKSWFSTSAGLYVTVKSPEYCPEAVARFISERFQVFEDAAMAGDAAALAETADLVSLARNYLILEYSHDTDAYLSSTYFYLAEDGGKLMSGPVWDFDIAYGMQPEGFFAGTSTLARALLGIPEVCASVLRERQTLDVLLSGTLLQSDPAVRSGRLRSLAGYVEELSASYAMDLVLWPEILGGVDWDQTQEKLSLDEHAAEFETYLSARADFLRESTADWATTTPTLPRFSDVWPGLSFAEDVEYLVGRGIMNGYDQHSFRPWDALSRAGAVTVLWRAAGSPAAEVSGEAWYAEAEAWALAEGLLDRPLDDPDGAVTRAEFLVLLWRLAGAPEVDAGAAAALDGTEELSEAERSAVAWALDRGLYTAEEAEPDRSLADDLPRGEAATLLARYLRG